MVNFNPAADFADITDGTEAVTVNRRGSSDNTSVATALQRSIRTSEVMASDGKYTMADVRWHLPIEEIATAPRPGDAIIDSAGSRWTVLALQEATLSSRWVCISRDLAVAFGLSDTIVIEQSTVGTDAGGGPTDNWQPWRTGIRARIQPTETIDDVQAGARRTVTDFEIAVEQDLTLDTALHRVRARDGTYYKIRGYRESEDISKLQIIEASTWLAS